MKQLVILSGKGGTGKTTVAGGFIHLAAKKGFVDCDVDAPNLHLICQDQKDEDSWSYSAYQKAFKDEECCLQCGKCEQLCRFQAIKNGVVNIYACEGCGVCEYFCTAGKFGGVPAIQLRDWETGRIYLTRVESDLFSHAELKMGSGASGKLVTAVRKQLTDRLTDEELVILDGSPGIGCPVLASITGTDLVLIVTEPTLSGLSDLLRLRETVAGFGVQAMVCVNKYDVNEENTRKIESFCEDQGLEIAGRIPYDSLVLDAVNSGNSILAYPDSRAANSIRKIWESVSKRLHLPI